MTEEAAHSRFGGSGAERWSTCFAAIELSDGLPDTAGHAAQRGTVMHEWAAFYLAPLATNGQDIAHPVETLTAGEREIVDGYVSFVRNALAEAEAADGQAALYVEVKFALPDIHPEAFGTADAVIVTPVRIIVLDFKSGRGVEVRPERADGSLNLQLAFYTWGVWQIFQSTFANVPLIEVAIYQPLVWDEPYWRRTSLLELEEQVDIMRHGADMSARGGNTPVAGDHCKFCAAIPICPAYRDLKLAVYEEKPLALIENPGPAPTMGLTNEQLARVVLARRDLEKWLDACVDLAKAKVKAGEDIGLKLVAGRGSREWIDEDALPDVVQEICNRHHGSIEPYELQPIVFKPSEVRSVAQIEDELKRRAGGGRDPRAKAILADLGKLYTTKPGAPVLAAPDDKRPAIRRLDDIHTEEDRY